MINMKSQSRNPSVPARSPELKRQAGDPETPIAVLRQLAEVYPSEVLGNPAFQLSMATQADFSRTLSESAQIALVRCEAADDSIRRHLAGDRSRPERVRAAWAASRDCPDHILAGFFTHNHVVRAALATNPKLDEAQLERLAEGGGLSVRVAVACHDNTSEELLVRLAYSVDMEVRFAVCSRTDLDADLLERIQAESRRFADEYQRLDEALEQFDFPFCVDREAVTDESLLAIMDLPPVLAGTDTREVKEKALQLLGNFDRLMGVEIAPDGRKPSEKKHGRLTYSEIYRVVFDRVVREKSYRNHQGWDPAWECEEEYNFEAAVEDWLEDNMPQEWFAEEVIRRVHEMGSADVDEEILTAIGLDDSGMGEGSDRLWNEPDLYDIHEKLEYREWEELDFISEERLDRIRRGDLPTLLEYLRLKQWVIEEQQESDEPNLVMIASISDRSKRSVYTYFRYSGHESPYYESYNDGCGQLMTGDSLADHLGPGDSEFRALVDYIARVEARECGPATTVVPTTGDP